MRKLIFTILMFLPLLAEAYDVEIDGIYYNLIKKQAFVTNATGNSFPNSYSGSVVIPSTFTYDGVVFTVVKIDDNAFGSCSGLTSVTIPNSVTSIGSYAFNYCSGLTSVTIPNSVTSIGEMAFVDCSGLTEVIIGNSVTSIGSQAFAFCKYLEDVYCYAERVPSLSNKVFQNSDVQYAMLHVPGALIDKYKAAEQWKDFGTIQVALPRCTTPTMEVVDGEVVFACETEGAKYHYEVNSPGKMSGDTDNKFAWSATVTFYATADGYMPSEKVMRSMTLGADGKVSIGDVSKLVQKLLKQNE